MMTYEFSNPLSLSVAVDGTVAGTYHLEYSAEGLSDVEFTIPGSAVKGGECEIAFLGDHITCGYWFFQ